MKVNKLTPLSENSPILSSMLVGRKSKLDNVPTQSVEVAPKRSRKELLKNGFPEPPAPRARPKTTFGQQTLQEKAAMNLAGQQAKRKHKQGGSAPLAAARQQLGFSPPKPIKRGL